MAASDIGIKIGLQGAEQVRTGLAGVTNSLTDLASRAGGLRDSLSAIAPTLAAAFSVGGIAAFVKSTTDALDRLNDISDATGSSVEEISKLERVAKLTGTSMDTVTGTLIKFNAALKEAKPGSGADAALKAIGLEAAKLRELDLSEALRKTAEALAGFADDGNKARIVQELFGKSLREAAPLLKDLAEFGELNASVTGEQAAQAEKFNRQLAALNANVSEAGRAFALELFPTISAVLESFTQFDEAGQKINTLATAIRVPIEALTIFGANIGFVFGGVGREIGAIAAQVAALSRLDLAGFRAISEAVKQDGERARRELEAFERRVLGIREAGGGRGFVNPEFVSGQLKAAADIATATNTATAAIDKNAEAVKRLTGSLEAKVAAQEAELDLGRSLTAAEQLELKLRQDLADGTVKLTEAEEKRVLALIGAVAANDELLRKEKQLAESRRENLDNATRAQNAANSLEDQVRAAREAVEAIGLQGVALAELEAARIRDTAAEKERRAAVLEGIDPEVAASYRAQAAALRELAGLKVEGAVKQATIDGTRAALDDARRTFDQVSQSLADALLNGGKSAGEALKRYFKTLILQPIIKAIVNPIAGAITGTLGLAGTANASTGSLGNVLSGASSASTFFSALNTSISSSISNGFTQFAQSSFGSRLGLSAPQGYEGTIGGTTNIATPGASQFGSYLGMAGNAFAGYAMGKGLNSAISNGYQISSGYTTFQNIGAAVAGAINPLLGAAVGAISGLVNRAFGRKLVDQGIQGTFGAGDGFTGEQFQFLKGGLFRSDKTNTSALDPQLDAALSGGFRALQTQVGVLAATLGIGSEAIGSFTREVKLSFQGLTEDQIKEKLTAEITAAGEALATLALGGSEFVREGETASQALQRLSASLVNVNAVLGTLGLDEFAKSVAGADLASQLADAFGGIANLQQATSSYFDNFYTEAQRTEVATRQLTESLGALGIETLPTTREAFRSLVEAQDLTTEAGRATFAALVQLSGSFAELVPAAEGAAAAVRSATDVLQEREGLERQLLQLQGNTVALRERERAALDETNLALFDQISALEDLQATAQRVFAALPQFLEEFYTVEERNSLKRQQFLDEFITQAVSGTFSSSAGSSSALNALIQGAESGAGNLRQLYRQLVEAQDLSTDAGRRAVAVLLEMAPAFAELVPAVDAAAASARSAADILNERQGLEQRLLQLQGNTAELRRRELAALDPSNRALLEQVFALEDAKAAQQAYTEAVDRAKQRLASAQSALDAAQSRVDAIRDQGTQRYLTALDAVTALQDRIVEQARQAAREYLNLAQNLRQAAAAQIGQPSQQFGAALSRALAGDKDALQSLSSLATGAIEQARAGAATSADARLAQARIVADLSRAAATAERLGAGGQEPDAAEELQRQLLAAQTDLAEALRVANAIGAPLVRSQADLIAQFSSAEAALKQAKFDFDTATKALADIVANTGKTASLIETTKAAALLNIDGFVNLVAKDSGLPDYVKALFLGTLEQIKSTIVFIADVSALPEDLKLLAINTESSLAKTVNFILGARLTSDETRLALDSVGKLDKTVNLAIGSDLPAYIKDLVLNQIGTINRTVQLALDPDLPADLRRLALQQPGIYQVTLEAVIGASISTDLQRVLLTQAGGYQVTVGALLSSTLPNDVKEVLLGSQLTAQKTVTLGAVLGSALTVDQRRLLDEAGGQIDKIVKAAISTGTLTAEQSALLAQQDDIVFKDVLGSIDISGLTAEQRKYLSLITGTSASSQVSIAGTVTFDPSDALKSIFNNISKTNELLLDAQQLFLQQLLGVAFKEDLTAAGAYNRDFLGTFTMTYRTMVAAEKMADIIDKASTGLASLQVTSKNREGAAQFFAKGGVFTSSIVNRATAFDYGVMGEAGPEAILPLKRTADGQLGVTAEMPDWSWYGRSDNSELASEVRALRSENAAQASALVQLQQRLAKVVERWDATGLPDTRVTA